MNITTVQGIIINEKPYSETSKLLTIITKEYGSISVLAKGAKSIKSKIRTVTTRLTYANFQIKYREGKLSTLICADIINPFNNIKSNLSKISYCSYILELTNQVLKQNYNSKIFDLLVEALLKIEESIDEELITNILELKYLNYLGINPNFDTCSICNNSKVITASVEKGGFVCVNHVSNERLLNPKTLKLLRMLYYIDINKITKINISNEIKVEINEFIDEYYSKYTGLYLNTKQFLKKIKQISV